MRIAALTFHDVMTEDAAGERPGDKFYRIGVAEMEALLSELKKRGYRTINSKSFREWQEGKGAAPDRSVVFTFDDGYASHFDVVVPLLIRYRFSGTFFVTTDFVGRPGYLSWDQLRKMVFLGMEIGSHGKTHRPLTSLSAEDLMHEVADSKRALEDELGVPVRSIAAPGGFWNRAVADAVKAAGYDAAWVSTIGTNGRETNPLALRRVPVHQSNPVQRLVSMVEGWQPAFWWAVGQQRGIRLLKRILGVYWYEQLKRRILPNA